ncbi:preQ(1) synthase [Pelagicoccus sp. SDUM812003]|uniref:preQ(1) synthase n=1 Tax=Pelagicoccus sp. SDUM812003 TaxID=3041267 RepID=UPI00280FD91B|nr:preQ(1) synthase [Pelagicoccus sp. SDUM812003]MDQ8205181.1 preQ(1) synthase [Pelagicoccus sp. SDUM812003]
MESKYLGKQVRQPIDELDTFDAPKGVSEVTMTSDEVMSSCPITGQPDLYTVSIEYVPHRLCIESKSLKLYLWGFREKSMFAEKMTAEICDRVVEDIQPKRCQVTCVQKARGGITIQTVARFPNEGQNS